MGILSCSGESHILFEDNEKTPPPRQILNDCFLNKEKTIYQNIMKLKKHMKRREREVVRK